MNLTVQMLENEYWYGFRVEDGDQFPLDCTSDYQNTQRSENITNNQEAPFLVSSKGRYIWCGRAFDLCVKNGVIEAGNTESAPVLYEGYQNLKGAFLAAARTHFPSDGRVPPKDFFTKPQYNTWIELTYNQNQADVLKYANGILASGLPAGILMIDDSWNCYYGRWEFNRATFPDPKAMVDALHRLGFSVMLWICPFVSPDSAEFRALEEKNCLVRDALGNIAIRHWWNGNSAVLDLSNPDAVAWLHRVTDHLQTAYGIDGFKFDAGDARFYRDDDQNFGNVIASEQCKLWAEFGADYAFNEYRACFAAQGLPLVQRLADKRHRWQGGVDLLIPDALSQGILGYAYGCPDMIGGGDFEDFKTGNEKLDEELFVRYAQCAALMPMMQYSAAPWRVLNKDNAAHCIKAGKIHEKFAEYIWQLAVSSSKDCQPIIRYMEYEFPGCGYETIKDQFMVGSDLLVAPVITPGTEKRTVMLPAGEWKCSNGKTYSGGSIYEIPAALSELLYFQKSANEQ